MAVVKPANPMTKNGQEFYPKTDASQVIIGPNDIRLGDGNGHVNIDVGDHNVIESIKKNGTTLAISNKAVDITVPTKVSDLTNDSGFITGEQDPTVPSWAKASSQPFETGAQVNKIEKVQKNGVDLVIQNKTVNVTVPTKTSDLLNDSGFINSILDLTEEEVEHLREGLYSLATQSANGLMSAADKTKLDGISPSASVGYVQKYEGAYTTVAANESTITIPINDYRSSDNLFVFVNGLQLIQNTDYTISGSTIVLTTPLSAIGTVVSFIAFRMMAAQSIDYTAFKGEVGEGVPVGGTAGQVLTKVSSTNYDTEWADPDTSAADSVDARLDDILAYHSGSSYLTLDTTNCNTGGAVNMHYNGVAAEFSGYIDFKADITNWTNRKIASLSQDAVNIIGQVYSDQHTAFAAGGKLCEVMLITSDNDPRLAITNMSGATITKNTQIKFSFTTLIGH